MTPRNEIGGVNLLNEHLWMARQIKDVEEWEGTGIHNHGILIFTDFRSALQHFLIGYPETDVIQGVLDGQYRIAYPNNAAATTILDAIAKELGK